MEGSSIIGSYCSIYYSSKPHFNFNFYRSPPPFSSSGKCRFVSSISYSWTNEPRVIRGSLRTSAFAVDEALDKSTTGSVSSSRDMLPKIDKSGRFCSPRAARELALLIAYAACLEGSDPVRLFEKRMNERREPGYEFDKNSLLEYNHMSFGGPPVTAETIGEADELLHNDEKESAIEAEVLSAPPKLVYSKLILRFTRKLLVAIVDRWDSHVLVIDKVAPPNWKNLISGDLVGASLLGVMNPPEKNPAESKLLSSVLPGGWQLSSYLWNEPAGRILELCILHMAMSEITILGTRHQIVINEAVDLAKRFCDGAAPRIINGCLRTFVKDLEGSGGAQALEAKQKVVT